MPLYIERRSDIEGITFFRLDELKIQCYQLVPILPTVILSSDVLNISVNFDRKVGFA